MRCLFDLILPSVSQDARPTSPQGIFADLVEGRAVVRGRHFALLLCFTPDNRGKRHGDRFLPALNYVADRGSTFWRTSKTSRLVLGANCVKWRSDCDVWLNWGPWLESEGRLTISGDRYRMDGLFRFLQTEHPRN